MITQKPRILCVDDEDTNLQLLEALLVPKEYECVFARNGREALEIIKEQRIDLVLLDVMMPDMDGFDVCRRIKSDEISRRIPVVMVTSLRLKEERIKSIQAGAEDFISKPIDKAEVIARVNMLIKMRDMDDRLNQAYSNKITDDAFAYTVQALARASEANDEDTGNHILRVGEYCALIARQLGMSKRFTNTFGFKGRCMMWGKYIFPLQFSKNPRNSRLKNLKR